MAGISLTDLVETVEVADDDLLLVRQGLEDKKYRGAGIFGGKDGLKSLAGWTDALLGAGGIIDNGLPDTAIASQRLDALKAVTENQVKSLARIKTTVAEIATGVFKDGDRLEVLDRSNAPFNVKTIGTVNGFNIIDAGVGRVAVLEVDLSQGVICSHVFNTGLTVASRLQKCMDLAVANKTKLVFDKMFDIDGSIVIPDTLDGLIITGMGTETGLNVVGTGGSPVIFAFGDVRNFPAKAITNLKLNNFAIKGNSLPSVMISLEGCNSGLAVEKLKLRGAGSAATVTSVTGIKTLDCWGGHIDNNDIRNCGVNLDLAHLNGGSITRNWITSSQDELIKLRLTTNVDITGNVIASAGTTQILFDFVSAANISTNNMESFAATPGVGIWLKNLSSAVTIENNLIWRSNGTATLSPMIFSESSEDCEISNNWIDSGDDIAEHIYVGAASKRILINPNKYQGTRRVKVESGALEPKINDVGDLLHPAHPILHNGALLRTVSGKPDGWITEAGDVVSKVAATRSISITNAAATQGRMRQVVNDTDLVTLLQGRMLTIVAEIKAPEAGRVKAGISVNGVNTYTVYHTGEDKYLFLKTSVTMPSVVTSLSFIACQIDAGSQITASVRSVSVYIDGQAVGSTMDTANASTGVFLRTPDGTKLYKLYVSNTGTVSAVQIDS